MYAYYIGPVHTWHRSQCALIAKNNQWMLWWSMTAVYCRRRGSMNAVSNWISFSVKISGTCTNHWIACGSPHPTWFPLHFLCPSSNLHIKVKFQEHGNWEHKVEPKIIQTIMIISTGYSSQRFQIINKTQTHITLRHPVQTSTKNTPNANKYIKICTYITK